MAQAVGPYTIEMLERLPRDGKRYEILSPSSARYDRGAKRARYLDRVAELWIVDPDARLIERWRPRDDRPAICREALEWQPVPSVPALSAPVAEPRSVPQSFGTGLGASLGRLANATSPAPSPRIPLRPPDRTCLPCHERASLNLKIPDIVRMLEQDGWYLARTRGSHRQYKHPTKPGLVTVAGKPGDDLAPRTANSVLRQAGLKR